MKDQEIQVSESQGNSMSVVTAQDVESLKSQRELLRRFVSSQLVQADFSDQYSPNYGEGDYGIITGTKKSCLFKQGAEKLQKLFKLGTRFTKTDSVIDREQNFAMFTYKAEVFHLGTGKVIAEQEGTANSQEVKYKTRTVWKTQTVNGKPVRKSEKEETPIFDVLNTLMKMAQKRAMVGATILATGASEFFTQDMLEPEDLSPERPIEPSIPKPQQQEKKKEEASGSTTNSNPVCCGKITMVSKYPDRETGVHNFYCLQCKKSIAPKEETQEDIPF